MGAGWRAGVVANRLRTLGGSGRRAAALATGAAVLSDREREVARLAAHGMTAREVAEQLFLSRRTVETHLANVYGKLGLASKRELVRRGRELGLIE